MPAVIKSSLVRGINSQKQISFGNGWFEKVKKGKVKWTRQFARAHIFDSLERAQRFILTTGMPYKAVEVPDAALYMDGLWSPSRWFDYTNLLPEYVGVYEVLQDSLQDELGYRYWDGKLWYATRPTVESAFEAYTEGKAMCKPRYTIKSHAWRGNMHDTSELITCEGCSLGWHTTEESECAYCKMVSEWSLIT